MQSQPQKARRTERRPDGRVILVAGASGSGKTAWVNQQTADARRVLVWDSLGQWSREFKCKPLTRPADLLRVLALPEGRFAYHVPIDSQGKAFALFCRAAWLWMKYARGVLIVEELADVTQPGKAPAAWGEIVRKSRHYGADVFALTQRPAESDKTVVGNAALIHCGLMAFPRDRKYMAECLDVDLRMVEALGQLQWIERNMRTRQLQAGILSFGLRKKQPSKRIARAREPV